MIEAIDIYKAVDPLMERIRKECFRKGYAATDAECLGLIVSKYFRWNGFEIGNVAMQALEDANFHDLARVIEVNMAREFGDVRHK